MRKKVSKKIPVNYRDNDYYDKIEKEHDIIIDAIAKFFIIVVIAYSVFVYMDLF